MEATQLEKQLIELRQETDQDIARLRREVNGVLANLTIALWKDVDYLSRVLTPQETTEYIGVLKSLNLLKAVMGVFERLS